MISFNPSWLVCAALLAGVSLVAGLVPGRLLRLATGGDWSFRQGLVLAMAGLAAGLAILAVGASGSGGPALAFDPRMTCALGACAVLLSCVLLVDLRAMVVADLHVALLLVLALVPPLARPLAEAALGALVGGGLMWGVRFAFKRARGVEGLGLGDVKLMVALGALLGPEPVLWVIVAGALLGLVFGLTLGKRRQPGPVAVPFAAAVAAPAFAALLGAAGVWS